MVPDSPEHPNLVLIVTDQERAPMHWLEGFAERLTSRSRLFRHGVNFENAVCNTAMCSPSRATLLPDLGKRTEPKPGWLSPRLAADLPLLADGSRVHSMGHLHRRPSPALVVAFIALLVALGGTAFAATATIVNIVDPTTQVAAKVTTAGALITTGTVSGSVATAAPKTPFNFVAISFEDDFQTAQMVPTTATLGITGIRVSNSTAYATDVTLQEYAVSTSCSTSSATGSRTLGDIAVPAGQTVEEQLSTPIVLKPLSTGGKWCLISFASGNTGSGLNIDYNGYVVSGTFASPSGAGAAPRAGRLGPTPRRR